MILKKTQKPKASTPKAVKTLKKTNSKQTKSQSKELKKPLKSNTQSTTTKKPVSTFKTGTILSPNKSKNKKIERTSSKGKEALATHLSKNIKKKLVSKKIIHKKPIKLKSRNNFMNNNTGLKTPTETNLNKAHIQIEDEKKAFLLNARKRTATPSIFKIRRKNTPIIFTLDDVKKIISSQKKQSNQSSASKANPSAIKEKPLRQDIKPAAARVLGAASLVDILGFNPKNAKATTPTDEESSKIPDKFKPYYALLVELRNHIQNEVNLHAKDALKRSSKEDSGDLSGYSQHMADAGTDTFDRELALSILSNEQDALFEIDEAVQRMITGTYGICEITGKNIPKERLLVVPFTRCSLEGQRHLERNQRRMTQRSAGVGVFSEIFDDEASFLEDDESSDT